MSQTGVIVSVAQYVGAGVGGSYQASGQELLRNRVTSKFDGSNRNAGYWLRNPTSLGIELMPEWNFFAFDTDAVANSILAPAQEAVRNRDLAAWRKVFDVLNGAHFFPHISRNGHCYVQPYSLVSGIVAPQFAISRDNIPDESDFGLRRTLQTFVEFMSPHSVQSRRVKLRNLVMNLIPWDKVLTSQEELDEIQLFQNTIIVRSKNLIDPFWCLESNDAADTNYANPETVAHMAEVESAVGLFRRLARRTDLDEGPQYVAPELATAGLLIELAATRSYGLYFREDGT